MASTVSSTDRKLFFGLSNPEKTRAEDDPLEEVPPPPSGGHGDAHAPPVQEAGDDADDLEELDDEDEEGEDGDEFYEGSQEDFGGDPDTMSRQDLQLEKQSTILELERLRAQGVTLSKTFTLSDPLSDMQFEVRRHLLHMDQVNSLSFMRDAMRLAFSGIEAANSMFGPVVELNGWSAHESQRITNHAYDPQLLALHKKYWRRGDSSPEAQLAFAILGSIGTYHFKQKMSNRPMRPTNLPADSDDESDEDVPEERFSE
jgi:hypothetical protein